MDPLTLVAIGILVALAVRPDTLSIPAACVVGAVAALAPDLDVVYLGFGETSYHLNRGALTHSLGAWLVASLLIGWVGARWLSRREPTRTLDVAMCAAAAFGSHLAIEALTLQGVRPFAPLANAELRWSLVGPGDMLLWIGLLLPLAWGTWRKKSSAWRSRAAIVGAVTAIVGHVGLHGFIQSQAAALAETEGLSGDVVWVWPGSPMSLNKKVYVLDGGIARRVEAGLLSQAEFVEMLPLNDTIDGFAEVAGLDTALPVVSRWDVPYAKVWAPQDQKTHHLFVADLRFREAGAPPKSPRIYGVVERSTTAMTLTFAEWRWEDETLRPVAPKTSPKGNNARPTVRGAKP